MDDYLPYRCDRVYIQILDFVNAPTRAKHNALQLLYDDAFLKNPIEINIINCLLRSHKLELNKHQPSQFTWDNFDALLDKRVPCENMIQICKKVKISITKIVPDNNPQKFLECLIYHKKQLLTSYIMMREWIVQSTNWSKALDFLEESAPIHYLVQLLKYQIALYSKENNIPAVFAKTTLDKLLKKETVWMYPIEQNNDTLVEANILQDKTNLSFGANPKIFYSIVGSSFHF